MIEGTEDGYHVVGVGLALLQRILQGARPTPQCIYSLRLCRHFLCASPSLRTPVLSPFSRDTVNDRYPFTSVTAHRERERERGRETSTTFPPTSGGDAVTRAYRMPPGITVSIASSVSRSPFANFHRPRRYEAFLVKHRTVKQLPQSTST